jgi:hypothetical protein
MKKYQPVSAMPVPATRIIIIMISFVPRWLIKLSSHREKSLQKTTG